MNNFTFENENDRIFFFKTTELLAWKNGELFLSPKKSFSIFTENAPHEFTIGSVGLWEEWFMGENDFPLLCVEVLHGYYLLRGNHF